jgi:hypothetical protein
MFWDRHRNDVSAWKLTLEQNCRKKVQYSGFSATSVFQWWGMPHESRKMSKWTVHISVPGSYSNFTQNAVVVQPTEKVDRCIDRDLYSQFHSFIT